MRIVCGVGEDQRALPEIGEQHGREHDHEPGEADRAGAEVPAVGVQRLGAGDRQHDAAEREERRHAVVDHEPRAPGRRERLEDARVGHDLARPEDADHREPDQDHRAEQPADRAGPRRWIANSPTRIPSEIGTTRCAEPGAATLSPSTAEVTEIAGRDHAVAEEQPGAEDPERDQQRRAPRRRGARSGRPAP